MNDQENQMDNPSKTGPKTNWKMTPETIRKLETAFAIDATIGEACFYADISEDTYYRWIKEQPELSEKFERLRNNPVLIARQSVVSSMPNNPDISLKYLERKRRFEFATRVENKQELEGHVQLTQEQQEHLERSFLGALHEKYAGSGSNPVRQDMLPEALPARDTTDSQAVGRTGIEYEAVGDSSSASA